MDSFSLQINQQFMTWLFGGGFATAVGAGYGIYRKAKSDRAKAEADKKAAEINQSAELNTARANFDQAQADFRSAMLSRCSGLEADVRICRQECAAEIAQHRAREEQQIEVYRERERQAMRENSDLLQRLARVEGQYDSITKVPVKISEPVVTVSASAASPADQS